MPNIPTYQSQEDPVTRPYSAQASGNAEKWVATQMAGRGISDVAHAGAQLAIQRNEKAAALKKLDDYRWATEATQAEQLNIATFMAQKENNTAEDFGDKVSAYTQQRFEQYASGEQAPSPAAFEMFKRNFSHLATQSTVSAIDAGANNKVAAIINSAKVSTASIQDGYRTLRATNEPLALKNLLTGIAQAKASIDAGIGQFAPDKAHQLHEDLITQSVLNVMGSNPGAAKAILNSSKDVDEQTRYQLNNEINQAARNQKVGQREEFDTMLANAKVRASGGEDYTRPSLDYYLDHYPEAQAKDMFAKDGKEFDVYDKARVISDATADKNANAQAVVLNNLDKNKSQDKASQDLYHVLAKTISDRIKLQDEDVVSFLTANNSHVKGLYDFAYTVQDPQDRSAAITTANDINLMYQGSAPKGTGAQELNLYLGHGLLDRHLLTRKGAEAHANQINMSSPKEVIKNISDLLLSNPKEEHQFIVFNDLVTYGKLSQEYQLVWQNKDEPWIDRYVGAIQAGKDVQVDEKTWALFDKFLTIDPTFTQFQVSMTGDNLQRAHQIAGFTNGVKQYAKVFVKDGYSPKEAVNMATTKLIGSSLGFTKVNDTPLMILKRDENGKIRSQEQIDLLGTNLMYATEEIPVLAIDTTPFRSVPGFDQVMAQDSKSANKAIGAYINQRTFWQTAANGQGAVLYGRGVEKGDVFQVSDKDGNPFVVHFKDLPDLRGAKLKREIEEMSGSDTAPFMSERSQSNNITADRPLWLRSK